MTLFKRAGSATGGWEDPWSGAIGTLNGAVYNASSHAFRLRPGAPNSSIAIHNVLQNGSPDLSLEMWVKLHSVATAGIGTHGLGLGFQGGSGRLVSLFDVGYGLTGCDYSARGDWSCVTSTIAGCAKQVLSSEPGVTAGTGTIPSFKGHYGGSSNTIVVDARRPHAYYMISNQGAYAVATSTIDVTRKRYCGFIMRFVIPLFSTPIYYIFSSSFVFWKYLLYTTRFLKFQHSDGSVAADVDVISGCASAWDCPHLPPLSGPVNSNGLLGWWRFNEDGGVTSKDWSGFMNDAIVSSGAFIANGAVTFDGTAATLSVGAVTDIPISGELTFASWVRFDAHQSGATTLAWAQYGGLGWAIQVNANPECVTIGNEGNGAGHACVFPFVYKGVSYTKCATYSGGQWCSLDTWYTSNWGKCDCGVCSCESGEQTGNPLSMSANGVVAKVVGETVSSFWPTGSWVHLAITYGSGSWKVYRNGVLHSTLSVSGALVRYAVC